MQHVNTSTGSLLANVGIIDAGNSGNDSRRTAADKPFIIQVVSCTQVGILSWL